MDEREFASYFDAGTSTLELSGCFDHHALPRIEEEVAAAHRRTACFLTVDLTGASRVPAHTVGRLVHLCHSQFPGTFVRIPVSPGFAAPMAAIA